MVNSIFSEEFGTLLGWHGTEKEQDTFLQVSICCPFSFCQTDGSESQRMSELGQVKYLSTLESVGSSSFCSSLPAGVSSALTSMALSSFSCDGTSDSVS